MSELRQEQSTSISVMLIVADADAAVAWYKDALGATELWNLGGVARPGGRRGSVLSP